VDSIVAAGQQRPGQHEPDESSGRVVVGQRADGAVLLWDEGAALLAGLPGSGKAAAGRLLLAQMRRLAAGGEVRVLDPKGAYARVFFGAVPGTGE
jgi:hypothetical protein